MQIRGGELWCIHRATHAVRGLRRPSLGLPTAFQALHSSIHSTTSTLADHIRSGVEAMMPLFAVCCGFWRAELQTLDCAWTAKRCALSC